MSTVIYKYPLTINQNVNLLMPVGAKILKVDFIPSHLTGSDAVANIWVEVEEGESRKEGRSFVTVETGERFDKTPDMKYIGSYIVTGLRLPEVYHVYEKNKL